MEGEARRRVHREGGGHQEGSEGEAQAEAEPLRRTKSEQPTRSNRHAPCTRHAMHTPCIEYVTPYHHTSAPRTSKSPHGISPTPISPVSYIFPYIAAGAPRVSGSPAIDAQHHWLQKQLREGDAYRHTRLEPLG